MKHSLRTFLLASILSVVFLCMVFFFLSTYIQTRHEVDEVYDSQLAQSARLLHALLLRNIDTNSIDPPLVFDDEQYLKNLGTLSDDDEISPLGHFYETMLSYQLWRQDGKLILRSKNAPEEQLTAFQAGFKTIQFKQKSWRSFTLQDKQQGIFLIVTEQLDIREEPISELTENLLAPYIVGIPTLLFILWHLIGRGLHPLINISQAIKNRQPSNLEPIQIEGLAPELLSIETALNSLLSRLKDTIEREKSFTDDAAHELRTPLAQIKIHSQNAQVSKSESDRQLCLNLLEQSVDQATRTIEQLLQLARLQSLQSFQQNDTVHLGKLARQQVAQLHDQLSQRQQHLELDVPDQLLPIFGNDLLIGLLFRNLLENASLYTPEKGAIRIRIIQENIDEKEKQETTLTFEDSGPGVEEAKYDAIFQRFHRENPGDANGAGLGLSIVSRIAELHAAKISPIPSLDAEYTGFCLSITFAH